MKKALILSMLVVGLVALAAAPAMAGGWWKITDGFPDDGINYNWGDYTEPPFNWSDADPLGSSLYEDVLGARSTASQAKVDDWGSSPTYYGADNPHGGFATTTNYCKTCHAVHDAGDSSYRLLKSGGAGGRTNVTDRSDGEGLVAGAGTVRANECMYCHDATSGATQYRPYALGEIRTVRGEHTIGATSIPDSSQSADVTTIAPILTRKIAGTNSSKLSNRNPASYGGESDTSPNLGCYDCHSVHGADVLAQWAPGRILRLDPSNDGIKLTATRAARAAAGEMYTAFADDPTGGSANGTSDQNMLRNNFCADCHNANASWDVTDDTARDNPKSHVTGPAANGTLEVYGTLKQVAYPGEGTTNPSANGTITQRGCRGCHTASDKGAAPIGTDTAEQSNGVAQSAWPHQSLSSKLLNESYQNGEINDVSVAGRLDISPDRSLLAMDQVCLKCHSANRDGTGPWGVGISF